MYKVSETNGFVIMYREEHELGIFSNRKYEVYHPNFDGVFIVDYPTLREAENFCNEENAR